MWRIWTSERSTWRGALAALLLVASGTAAAQGIAEPQNYYGMREADYRWELKRLVDLAVDGDVYQARTHNSAMFALRLAETAETAEPIILDPEYKRLADAYFERWRKGSGSQAGFQFWIPRTIHERRLDAFLAQGDKGRDKLVPEILSIAFYFEQENRREDIDPLLPQTGTTPESVAVRDDGQSRSLMRLWSDALIRQGEADRAIRLARAAFERALKGKQPELILSRGYGLLDILGKAGRHAEALAVFDQVAAKVPPDPRYAASDASMRRQLLIDAKRYAEVEKAYRAVLADPRAHNFYDKEPALVAVASILREQKKWEALETLIAGREPRFPGQELPEPGGMLGVEYAHMLVATGRTDKARPILEDAIKSAEYGGSALPAARAAAKLWETLPSPPTPFDAKGQLAKYEEDAARPGIEEALRAASSILTTRIGAYIQDKDVYDPRSVAEGEKLLAVAERLLKPWPATAFAQERGRLHRFRGVLAMSRGDWLETYRLQKLSDEAWARNEKTRYCLDVVDLHKIVKPPGLPLREFEAGCTSRAPSDDNDPALQALVAAFFGVTREGGQAFAVQAARAGLRLVDEKALTLRVPAAGGARAQIDLRERQRIGRSVFADALFATSGTRATPAEIEEVYTGFQWGLLDASADAVAIGFAGRNGDRIRPGFGALTREYLELADEVNNDYPGPAIYNNLSPCQYPCPKPTPAEIAEEKQREAQWQIEKAAADKRRAQRDTRLKEIGAIIARDFPAYFDLIAPKPLDFAETRAVLKSDEAILLIVPTPQGTHIVALDDKGSSWARSDWNEKRIARSVTRLMWDVGAKTNVPDIVQERWEDDAGEGYPYARGAAFELYQQIVAPALPILQGKKRVFISTGPALSALPFAMLVTAQPQGSDGDPATLRATEWFGDKLAIIRLPSIQSLKLLRGRAPGETPGGIRFAGFGDPLLSGKARSRSTGRLKGTRRSGDAEQPMPPGLTVPDQVRTLARLEGTARELTAMRTALAAPPASIHLAAGATEPVLYATDLSKVDILAFATHGLMAGDLPGVNQAALVMTPPSQAVDGNDGVVTSAEIAGLRLDADWVLLSACNTAAAGEIGTGAVGLSQLVNAFFFAGARSVLASHWPVDDDIAALLSVDAIERRKANPKLSRAEALQQAMQAIRKDATHDGKDRFGRTVTWAHPAAWAPFSIIGDVGE